MLRLHRHRRRNASWFDMTPMIDVVFQLIIFFMYTTQFSQLVRTRIDLPEEPGEAKPALEEPEFVIDVRADGTYVVAGDKLDREHLRGRVAAQALAHAGGPSDFRVLVRADREALTAAVNALAIDLTSLGIKRWRLGVATPPGSPRANP